MSNSPSVKWLKRFLFGDPEALPSPPPRSLQSILLRMEAERIPWAHIVSHGGFTQFAYHVHGDLNSLLDFLETRWSEEFPEYPGLLKTRAVAKFWDALQIVLAVKRKGIFHPTPEPCAEDEAILNEMLNPRREIPPPFAFRSAAFWGEIARTFVNLNRPVAAALLPPSSKDLPKLHSLYEMACRTRGQHLDPHTLHLVPHVEYVNAAHWRTDQTLEAFLHAQPQHPLTRSVRALLERTVTHLLNGEGVPFLPSSPRLDAFLHNVNVIHRSLREVVVSGAPPKLIDVFQRLLASTRRDDLWEEEVPPPPPPPSSSASGLLAVTEKIRLLERENHYLLSLSREQRIR